MLKRNKISKQKEVEFLNEELIKIKQAKNLNAKEHNYEVAAEYRDKERLLIEKIDNCKKMIGKQ